MNLVLQEEIGQGDQGNVEATSEKLPQENSPGVVVWAQGKAANGPWNSGDEVRNHEDVVPVVVISRRDVGPASTRKGSKDTDTEDELGERRAVSCGQDVPHGDQDETGACRVV